MLYNDSSVSYNDHSYLSQIAMSFTEFSLYVTENCIYYYYIHSRSSKTALLKFTFSEHRHHSTRLHSS